VTRAASMTSCAWLALVALATGPGASAVAADSGTAPEATCPRPFKATFDVEWHGFSAGTSTLELIHNGGNHYTYSSRNRARGLFRLAIPDTITQISNFTIENGKVIPATYVGDDGSSDTDRDVSLKFDWIEHRVTGIAEDRPVDQPLEPGVQDSLTVQIALMCELAQGRSPASFQLIDKDEVKEYQYTREGDATLTTSIGKLDTVIYRSQRTGSSRYTRLWIVPSLGYLPVRAEQAKRDKRELQLQIRSLERP
jgi:Protein of unknown function (DUF3108)